MRANESWWNLMNYDEIYVRLLQSGGPQSALQTWKSCKYTLVQGKHRGPFDLADAQGYYIPFIYQGTLYGCRWQLAVHICRHTLEKREVPSSMLCSLLACWRVGCCRERLRLWNQAWRRTCDLFERAILWTGLVLLHGVSTYTNDGNSNWTSYCTLRTWNPSFNRNLLKSWNPMNISKHKVCVIIYDHSQVAAYNHVPLHVLRIPSCIQHHAHSRNKTISWYFAAKRHWSSGGGYGTTRAGCTSFDPDLGYSDNIWGIIL